MEVDEVESCGNLASVRFDIEEIFVMELLTC
jgi:hypothetical protein